MNLRQDVLDGIDQEIARLSQQAGRYPSAALRLSSSDTHAMRNIESALKALRLLRVDTERHINYVDGEEEAPFCGCCSEQWPCRAIAERAVVYAKEGR